LELEPGVSQAEVQDQSERAQLKLPLRVHKGIGTACKVESLEVEMGEFFKVC
jgi:hypothetical protein